MSKRTATPKTECEGCGKLAAGGGHRFCYACICILLSPPPPDRRELRAVREYGTPYRIRYAKKEKPADV